MLLRGSGQFHGKEIDLSAMVSVPNARTGIKGESCLISLADGFYSDNQEDAILMSLHRLQNIEYLSFLQSTLHKLPYYSK